MATEADDDAVDVGFDTCLAVPAEGAVGKVDDDAVTHERLPQVGDLLTLANGICRNESRLDGCPSHQVGSLLVPAAHIVHVADILPFCAKHFNEVLLLPSGCHPRPHKRWVAHDVIGQANIIIPG